MSILAGVHDDVLWTKSYRISLLDLAQKLVHGASSVTPKSLLIRARKSSVFLYLFLRDVGSETRKTYRAVLSEPKLVIPTSAYATTFNSC